MTNNQVSNSNPNWKVTIGMPVFNVANYIAASLTSALEQDMDGIEILAIDDCGTDASMEIIRQMQATHPRGNSIRIIRHDTNSGVAEARNTIIREARGKYIFFLDSDDTISSSAISTLYHTAETEEAELTYGSSIVREMDGKEYPYFVLPRETFSGRYALVNYIYSDLRQNIPYHVWNILFLTSFLHDNGFSFPLFRTGEDVLFNDAVQPKVTKAVLLPNITYYYQKRPYSLMRFQARDTINVQEAHNSINYSEMQKGLCLQLRNEPYFAGKCAKTMKNVFYRACGILKHRHQLSGGITDQEIRDMMRHPATLMEILNFKQQRNANLSFWLLGKLPPNLSVWIIKNIGEKKGYIS